MKRHSFERVICMNAYFFPTNRRRVKFFLEAVRGMPLLRVELPGRLSHRSCAKVIRCFDRYRVHQTFNGPGDWPGSALPPLSDTRSLWTAKAADAAALILEHRGRPPQQAKVELYSDRFGPREAQLIGRLLPRFRDLTLSLPVPEEYLWLLQQQYGVTPSAGAGDLSLCLAPAERAHSLDLWFRQPQPRGLEWTAAEVEVPPDCPAQPLLAALVEQGRASEEEIEIRLNFS